MNSKIKLLLEQAIHAFYSNDLKQAEKLLNQCLAIELALILQKLADVKDKLANRRITAPLFDTSRFTKNLEAVYLTMYERHQIGLEPAHISIT